MAAAITKAGESLIAQKQAAGEVLEVVRFVLALVPDLDPSAPVDRDASKPPPEQVVYTEVWTQKGFVNPNQVIYSLMMGSDIGDFDWNWIGLETAEGVLLSVAYVPIQQKRKNIPPHQIGNNVTRNFMVVFDGAQALTEITVDASTWQHDFTVRLAGIDERERLSNRNLYGRAFFYSDSLAFGKVESGYQINGGTAYIEGIRVAIAQSEAVPGVIPVGKVWLDVCLERQLNDRVAIWKVTFGEQQDYTDDSGERHYCVPIADFISSTDIVDLRDAEPVGGALIKYLASRTGDYPLLRARATTKDDVELDQIPNAISDDPTTNSSQILATTAALNNLAQQVNDPFTGMVSFFAMHNPPTGWLRCNAAELSRVSYARLFERIGTTFGEGDGATTFNLPDARGLFLRALDEGRGLDVDRVLGTQQAHMLAWHDHAAYADAVGDHVHAASVDAQGEHVHGAWTDEQGTHTHPIACDGSGGEELASLVASNNADEGRVLNPAYLDYAGNHAHNIGVGAAGLHGHNVAIGAAGYHTHAVYVSGSGGHETRPQNIALLCCIKF